MAFALQFDGDSYAAGPTLGNILALNTISVECENVSWAGQTGYLFSQAGSANREFGLFRNATNEIVVMIGGDITPFGNVTTLFGSSTITGKLRLDVDFTAPSASLYLDDGLIQTITPDVGVLRNDGGLFRIGARADDDTSGSTTGAYIMANGDVCGNTSVTLNGTLTRTYVSDGTGTTWEETTNSQDATLYNSAGDDSEWVIYGVSSGTTIGNPAYNNIVYQRDSLGDYTVSFPVTYLGTPTALKYQLLRASDDAIVTDWTVFDASPTGGTSTLTLTLPGTTTGYYAKVREDDDAGTESTQTSDWYIGHNVLLYGQSLPEDMSTNGAITASQGHFEFSGSAGVSPTTGTGQKGLADRLIAADDCAVMIINTSVGGSGLTPESEGDSNYWSNPSSTLFSSTATDVNTATDGGNRISFAHWNQGGRDSVQGVSEEDYFRINQSLGLTALLKNSRDNWTGADGEPLPIVVGVIGRGNTTDANRQAIRDATIAMVNADPNCYHAPCFPYANTDGTHFTDAGYQEFGEDVATLYYQATGDVTVSPPALYAVTINDTRDVLTLHFDQDLLGTDTTYGTEGVRVEVDGSPATINSFARSGTSTADITLSAGIGASAVVRVYLHYGAGTTNSAVLYPRSADVTLPGTAGTTNIKCESTNALLREVQ